MASPGTDIAFSEARTEGYRAFANKIWNAARFLFMQFERGPGIGRWKDSRLESNAHLLPPETPLETKWIFSRLHSVAGEVDRALAQYRFDEAANAIYRFFWGEFCDWYLELVKVRLDVSGEDQEKKPYLITLVSLFVVYEAALRLLSPFMPFITEELWHHPLLKLVSGTDAKSIALTRYPQAKDYPSDPSAEAEMALLQDLIVTVRALRKELGVPEKETAPIILHADNRIVALADANQDMLSRMARVASVEFASEPLTGANARSTADFDVAVLYERQIDIPAECERLTKDLAKYEKGLSAAERQLNNESFMAKAPAPIVDGLRKQHAETKTLYEKTKSALETLGC
jgi:valyl-tRNA synthetase